ncbi:YqaE/Pmp3 family membrane protein [Sphingomonas montana]|uniref:YqaE/Pmp3 family membrane protein n=1 Tax=Sphingomonas montana TaxID=1843236 RepID=UPI00096C4AF2|nr:YqaE/Pmp3 family membrane protein [Sphingomonas montana]
MALLHIVAAILLPPLGIFLARGLGRDFWIGVLLTLIAFVPGMLFALYVVISDHRRPAVITT